jgi:GNAT superfamily N-acetyltransferase
VTDEYVLRAPNTPDEWQAYHTIRREVLFETRGLIGVYNESHPDEHREDHYPLLLFLSDQAIGVIRVDLAGAEAIFRRVAIRANQQRMGHGRKMLALAERFAYAKGCVVLRSSVEPTAVAFYARCGFLPDDMPGTLSSVPMWKQVDGRAAG